MSPSLAPRAREVARTPAAQVRQRRELLDQLVQHPDVFRYLAEQAADLAGEFPEGSREQLTLLLLDQSARGVADLLEEAEQVKAS